jgi:hypothetical protein
MRQLLLLTILSLATTLAAQGQTGRHFQRSQRTPTTPAAATATAVEASATPAPAPLQKMRSGRAWPRWHYGRLPAAAPASSVQIVDAAARRSPAKKRGFWRAHG